MAYIVVYQATEGTSGYEPCDSLQSAILAAERMRNVDDVQTPRIFRTEEVHFDFRPYYRIEVANDVPAVVADSKPEPPLEALLTSQAATESEMNDVRWPGGLREASANGHSAPETDGVETHVDDTETVNDSVSDVDLGVPDMAPSSAHEAVEEAPANAAEKAPVEEDPVEPAVVAEVSVATVDVADTVEEAAAESGSDVTDLPDPVPLEMAELTDSVISPRRGLFGR